MDEQFGLKVNCEVPIGYFVSFCFVSDDKTKILRDLV